MKIKKSLFLLMVVLLPLLSLAVSCSENTEDATEADNPPASNFFLDLGYQNCLMCHGSSDNNINKNLSKHCLYFDPEAFMRITDIDYSPTLGDCLLCHTSHTEKGRRTTYECGRCHYG